MRTTESSGGAPGHPHRGQRSVLQQSSLIAIPERYHYRTVLYCTGRRQELRAGAVGTSTECVRRPGRCKQLPALTFITRLDLLVFLLLLRHTAHV